MSGELFGWGLALVSMLSIPLYALWYIVRIPGTCSSVSGFFFSLILINIGLSLHIQLLNKTNCAFTAIPYLCT